MNDAVRMVSPAKINLHLEIGSRRPDGYHLLRSVFQMIDLQDVLTIRLMPASRGFVCTCSEYEIPEHSTLSVSWKAFLDASGMDFGCSVKLVKHIPPQAGLGGGSSNAAALLLGLNMLAGKPLEFSRLAALGAAVGSDVPFFFSSPAAVAEGTGEVLFPAVPVDACTAVVAKPSFGVSTAWAYQQLDLSRKDPADYRFELSREYCLHACAEEHPSAWKFFNSFEPLLYSARPEYEELWSMFKAHGACFTALSGSGAAVTGLFSEPADARRCLKDLHNRLYWVKIVKILANSPFAVYNTN